MRELNERLKDYISKPVDAKRDVLLKLLQDYRQHVEDGAVKPPRFS